jgi:hypothetical protein
MLTHLVFFLIATGEPEGILVRTSDRYAPDAKDTDRASATLLALVRNEEVDDMVASMVDLERTWNSKFNYPWTFFNDKPFSEEFKKKTSAVTNATCNYGMLSVPPQHEVIAKDRRLTSSNPQSSSPRNTGTRRHGSTRPSSKSRPPC